MADDRWSTATLPGEIRRGDGLWFAHIDWPRPMYKYAVVCPDCGSSVGWLLSLVTPTDASVGERAGLECDNGHLVEHPLVYPGFIRALFAGAAAGRSPSDALVANDWRPHVYRLRPAGGQGCLPRHEYIPWEQAEPGNDAAWWNECWPELIAAAAVSSGVWYPGRPAGPDSPAGP